MNALDRYLTAQNAQQKPWAPRRTPMARFWRWSYRNAATGWPLVLILTMALIILYAVYFEARFGEALRAAVWQ